MNSVLNLTWVQLGLAYGLLILALIILRLRGISRNKEILYSIVRMTLQLIVVGHLLLWIFDHKNPWFTILTILLMEVFAVLITFGRIKQPLSLSLKSTIAIAMAGGTLFCIFYFLLVVVQVKPWYNPVYFIPLSGMMIGNAMTGISVGASRLITTMQDRRDQIEAALMLGASPKVASKAIVDEAFDTAITPTILSMLGTGIVSLPGMMSGQILSGESPLLATKYQIAILLGIFGSVTCTVAIFVFFAYRSFFNRHHQLKN